jgi:hypothetical protein
MLNSGGEAAIIWHRPRSGRSTYRVAFSRVISQPLAAASTSPIMLARLLETEPIVLPHCEFMEIRHIKQW